MKLWFHGQATHWTKLWSTVRHTTKKDSKPEYSKGDTVNITKFLFMYIVLIMLFPRPTEDQIAMALQCSVFNSDIHPAQSFYSKKAKSSWLINTSRINFFNSQNHSLSLRPTINFLLTLLWWFLQMTLWIMNIVIKPLECMFWMSVGMFNPQHYMVSWASQ